MSIQVFEGSGQSGIAQGATRSQWWTMRPRIGGAGAGNSYFRARGLVDAANVLPGALLGAGGAYTATFSPALGAFINCQGPHNGNPNYITLSPPALIFPSTRWDQPFSGINSPADQVVIFRELVQWFNSNPLSLTPGHCCIHGFSMVANLLSGNPYLTTGSFRGIGLAQLAGNAAGIVVKNANPASIINLPGLDLTAARYLVEHRAYAPTAAARGRYECWINGQQVARVEGNAANFPLSAALADMWCFMPFGFGGTSATADVTGIRRYWGEIIAGPDVFATY